MFFYLPVVCKVGLEDVLDVDRVDCVYVVAEGSKHPERLVLLGEIGLEIEQSVKVQELLDDGACNRREISLFLAEAWPQYEETE